jgi:glucose-6-phosphate 1-dehydrogenase
MQSPFIIVIFGATGDLAQHKLFPALFSLYKQGTLSKDVYLVGFARRELTDNAYQEFLAQEMDVSSDPQWEAFASRIFYQQGLFDEPRGYTELIEKLHTFDKQIGACLPRVFYLATPPDNYPAILQNLTATKLSEGCGLGSEQWTRVAIEKPFGKDLETAKNLDKTLSEMFEEKQIFRVDHYLGKETVQNILVSRFANTIFEPLWNRNYIDHVEITVAEQVGVEHRGRFYDQVGVLRDMFLNHLLQLVSLVAMEPPVSFDKSSSIDVQLLPLGTEV